MSLYRRPLIKRRSCVASATLCAVLFVLLLSPFSAIALEVVDDTGRPVKLKEPAQRIISLSPHATELLFAAGAGEKVVGVVNYSNYPREAARIEQLGDSNNLDLERIIGLQPDLVVAWRSGNSSGQVEKLADMGLPVFYSEPRHLKDIPTNLERLGELAGSRDQAHRSALMFRERLRRLSDTYAQRKPVRVFYEIWHQPLMTVTGDHLINRVINLCGGENIFGRLPGLTSTINLEAVLAADPQAIITANSAQSEPEWLKKWKRWPRLSAVKNEQLYTVPADIIQRQTPRILDGAELLCEQLANTRRLSDRSVAIP